jgi:hypothetical protein
MIFLSAIFLSAIFLSDPEADRKMADRKMADRKMALYPPENPSENVGSSKPVGFVRCSV